MITALQLIDDLRGALTLVAADSLRSNVVASVLPSGAATAAAQTTMITALQLIDDLRGALDSVDTDELVVNVDESALPSGAATSANQATVIARLQDQVFTYRDNYQDTQAEDNAVAGTNTLDSTTVGADRVVCIRNILAYNIVSTCTVIGLAIRTGAANYWVRRKVTVGIAEEVIYTGALFLNEGDCVRAQFEGCTLNDDLRLTVCGYTMTRD
jgi:hypothetical protein